MIDEDSDEFIALDAQVTGHVSDNALKTWKRLKQEHRDAMKLVHKLAALVWEDSADPYEGGWCLGAEELIEEAKAFLSRKS